MEVEMDRYQKRGRLATEGISNSSSSGNSKRETANSRQVQQCNKCSSATAGPWGERASGGRQSQARRGWRAGERQCRKQRTRRVGCTLSSIGRKGRTAERE